MSAKQFAGGRSLTNRARLEHGSHRQYLRSPRSAARLQVKALFGRGKSQRDEEKEEMYRLQQEMLQKRKSGDTLKEANARRQKVSDTVKARKEERRKEREMLGQGIMPDSLKDWKNYNTKDDEEGTSGIIVPLFPFGRVKYDQGERFDLRSPYADDGWVDPDETDAWSGIKQFGKKLLNFGGSKEEPGERKPIIWASEYGKYLAEKMKAAGQEITDPNNKKKRKGGK